MILLKERIIIQKMDEDILNAYLRDDYQEIIELAPPDTEDPSILSYLGIAHHHLHDEDKAKEYLLKAFRNGDSDDIPSKALAILGDIYTCIDNDLAFECYYLLCVRSRFNGPDSDMLKYFHRSNYKYTWELLEYKKRCQQEIKSLQEENSRLRDELQLERDFQPGGKGYLEAESHFNNLQENLKK